MGPTIIFRPVASRVYAVIAWLVAATVAGAVLYDGGAVALVRFGAFPLLLAGFAWAVLWWPYVRVDDGGVEVANLVRTTRVPWQAITGVETRWGLRLLTAAGKVDAWAAPARGALSRVRADRAASRRGDGGPPNARGDQRGSVRQRGADEVIRHGGDAEDVAAVVEARRAAHAGATPDAPARTSPGTGGPAGTTGGTGISRRVNVVPLAALLVPAVLVVAGLL